MDEAVNFMRSDMGRKGGIFAIVAWKEFFFGHNYEFERKSSERCKSP